MSGPRRNASNDDTRISTTAALIALGGHVLIIVVALMLAESTRDVVLTQGVVGVTLVSGLPGDAASPSSSTSHVSVGAKVSISENPPRDIVAAGERLDQLIAPDNAAASSVPAQSTSLATAARTPLELAIDGSGAQGRSGASGSIRASQGLGPGESAQGIDLYAAASLPSVGTRPASPPVGDLWQRVMPCWRSASPRKTTLLVEIGADGSLIGSPQAVRKVSASGDSQTLLAERAAARALQACAPYTGLGGRRWRVMFP